MGMVSGQDIERFVLCVLMLRRCPCQYPLDLDLSKDRWLASVISADEPMHFTAVTKAALLQQRPCCSLQDTFWKAKAHTIFEAQGAVWYIV